MISAETIERVREAADMVKIASPYTKLKKNGRSWRGPCPIHKGKGPNFSVIPDEAIFTCFSCGKKGDVFKMLELITGCDFGTAVRTIAEDLGIEIVETGKRDEADPREPIWDVNAAAAEFFTKTLWEAPEAQAAREYLDKRGLIRAEADKFGLGFAPGNRALPNYLTTLGYTEQVMLDAGLMARRDRDNQTYARFRDRLMFPIADAGGRIVGFGGRALGDVEGAKYLNTAETVAFSKGRTLYNLNNAKGPIRHAGRVVVVEGYFDVIRLSLAGLEEVVAGLGTALTEEHASVIARYTKDAVLLYDADSAGLKATFRAAHELLKQRVAVRVVTLPVGEDPDSIVKTSGLAPLNKSIEKAVDVFERQIEVLTEKGWMNDLSRRRRAMDRLLPTIHATADPLTRGLYVGRLAEVTGVPVESITDALKGLAVVLPTPTPLLPPKPATNSPQGASDRAEEGQADKGKRAPQRPATPVLAGSSKTMEISEKQFVQIVLSDPALLLIAEEVFSPERLRNAALCEIYSVAIESSAPPEVTDPRLTESARWVLAELLDTKHEVTANRNTLARIIQTLERREYEEQLRAIEEDQANATGDRLQRLVAEAQDIRRRLATLPGSNRWKVAY